MATDDSRHGLVVKGFSRRKSFYFLLLAVFSTSGASGPSLEHLSAAGAPKSHYFSPVNTLSGPEKIRNKVLDVRRRMMQERKQFYVQEVEEQFDHFFKSNLSQVVDFLEKNDLAGLEKFILDNFYRFEINQVNAAGVSPAPLLGESTGSTQPAEERASGAETSGSSGGATTVEIAPEIDVQQGVRVEELTPGTPVVVRLTERSSDLFGTDSERKPKRISADFLSFDSGGKEPEGELRVRIQENLHGVGEVSRGSLIRLYRAESETARDEYERQLQPLIWIVVALMLLLVVFVYLVIF